MIWTLLVFGACTGGEVEPPAPEPTTKPDPLPDMPKISAEELKKTAEDTSIVPSPIETQSALESAGIETKLATLIPTHDFDMDNEGLEHAAIRSGVLLADMMLTVKTAEKADLLKRVEAVRVGISQLDGGKDIDRTMQDYKESIEADAIGREELLKEFDQLSGAVIPELKFNGSERVVPLIQAGSWLEGANLMARAVKDKGKFDAADGLLKQPAVVDYFVGYVKDEGGNNAPPQVATKLEESLMTLKGLAEKKEALTEADIDTVIQVTSNVLALL